MAPFAARARFGAAIVLAFVCGLVFASGFDLTRFGYAQGSGKPSAQAVKPLAEQSNAFVTIAEHVTPAVVSIQTERDPRRVASSRQRGRVPPGFEEFFNQFEGPRQQEPVSSDGSGFIVSQDGYILTNNHVVGDADRVRVTLADHRVFPAKVVGGDPTTDVALIKIEGKSLPTVSLGNDESIRVGEWVVAIGNPLGLDFTVTAGIVSAKGRSAQDLPGLLGNQYAISDFIQTDAAINPGNSGGPLVNIRGEVIGINSAIASRTGYYSGYGFAIPVTLARNVMDDLIKHGRVRRAVLGIQIQAVQPEDAAVAGLKQIAGVRVGAFSPTPEESPARKAGLELNDVIVAIDGRQVDRVSTLQRLVRLHDPGETVTVDVMRYGERKSFRVRLTEPREEEEQRVAARPERPRPANGMDDASRGKLGVAVEPLSAEGAREARLTEPGGLRVVEVNRGGPAYGKLFENSDIILDVLYPGPRRPVRTIAELQRVLGSLKEGDYISLHVHSIAPPLSGTRVVNLRIGG